MRAVVLAAVLSCCLPGCLLAEGGEELCDDDIDNDADGRVDCADPACGLVDACSRCGDGALDDAEACDDGNRKNDDGCSDRCARERCGNGELDDSEECDDGNLVPGDGCNFRCQFDRCGDRVVNLDEQCDDGNVSAGDGCSRYCQVELEVTCGNGVFDPFEQCEDNNQRGGDGCSPTCQAEFCGDGVVQPALGEQCEGAALPDGSRCEFCRINRCGNDSVDVNEQCDDGNRFDGDGCSSACTTERCGDFIVQAGEQCEDGNAVDGDGCNAQCRSEFCGDGVVQPRLGELCDDGSAPACNSSCQPVLPCAALPSGADACFAAEVRNASLVARHAALVRQGDERWIELASLQSGFVDRHVIVPPGVFFAPYPSSPIVVAAFDADGDGADETLTASFEATLAVNDVSNPNSINTLAVLFLFSQQSFVPVLELGGGTLGGAAAPDVFALQQGGSLGVALDPLVSGPSATLSLAQNTLRVVAAPLFSDAGGLMTSAGASLVPVSVAIDDGALVLAQHAPVPTGADIGDLAVVDLDDDGAMELLVLHRAPDELLSYALTADVPLADPTVLCETPGADRFSVGDVDDDGALDVVTASARGALTLHLAAEDFGASSELPAPSGATRPVIADLDGDGDTDLATAGGFFLPLLVLYLGL